MPHMTPCVAARADGMRSFLCLETWKMTRVPPRRR